MRNKPKIISFLLLVSLILPTLAAAQTRSDVAAPDSQLTRERQLRELQNNQQKRIEALREEAKKRIEEAKEQGRESRIRTLKKLAETQAKRTEDAVGKLATLIGKIERVLASLRERGVDTTSLASSLDRAKTLKAEAETMLARLKASHESIDATGTEPKRQVQAFMTEMNNIKKKLIELHRALTDIIKEIRKLEPARPESNSSQGN